MARRQLLKSLPRVELDHRARDARDRLVHMERLLVPRAAVMGSWLSPFIRLLGSRAGSSRGSNARERGSEIDPRLGCSVRRPTVRLSTGTTSFPNCRRCHTSPTRDQTEEPKFAPVIG
jgi:hypothetical protein